MLTERETSEHRHGWHKRERSVGNQRKIILGWGDSQCKGLKVGACLGNMQSQYRGVVEDGSPLAGLRILLGMRLGVGVGGFWAEACHDLTVSNGSPGGWNENRLRGSGLIWSTFCKDGSGWRADCKGGKSDAGTAVKRLRQLSRWEKSVSTFS